MEQLQNMADDEVLQNHQKTTNIINQNVQDKFNTLYSELPDKYQIPALQSGYNTYKQCIDLLNEDRPQKQDSKLIHDNQYERLYALVNNLNDNLKGTSTRVQDVISVQRETQQKIDQVLLQSVKRGSFAEQTIELQLQKALPNFIIENTSKIANSGDLQVFRNPNQKILLEIKNYTNTVPSSEVDKFITDVSSNTQIKGGIFISLGQKITKRANIQTEKLQNNKLVSYLGGFGLDNFDLLIYIILFMEQTNDLIQDNKLMELQKNSQILFKKKQEYIAELQKERKRVEKHLNLINTQIKLLEQLDN